MAALLPVRVLPSLLQLLQLLSVSVKSVLDQQPGNLWQPSLELSRTARASRDEPCSLPASRPRLETPD
jgi:hypothetical protein